MGFVIIAVLAARGRWRIAFALTSLLVTVVVGNHIRWLAEPQPFGLSPPLPIGLLTAGGSAILGTVLGLWYASLLARMERKVRLEKYRHALSLKFEEGRLLGTKARMRRKANLDLLDKH